MTPILTSLGVASRTLTPACAAASRTTPRACPTPKAVCALREKNTRSTATMSGWWVSISSATSAWMSFSRSGIGVSGLVVRQP